MIQDRLIDFHAHCFPDRLAARAVGQLQGETGLPPKTDGTLTGTRKRMEAWGVRRFVIQNIAVTPEREHNVNSFAIEINDLDTVFAFGSVHPASPHAIEELRRLHAAGIRGIKLHPEYQRFDIDDRMAYPIYEVCTRLGMILFFHTGWDPAYPDSRRAYPAACARVAQDFPDATLVFAHGGGNRVWDEVERLLCGSHAYFDIALMPLLYPAQDACRLIRRHGADKILFGSDCPWGDVPMHLRYLDSMNLTEEERAYICYKNAERLLSFNSAE